MKKIFALVDAQNVFINNNNFFVLEKISNFLKREHSKFDDVFFFKFLNFRDSNFFRLLNYKKALSPQEIKIHPILKNIKHKEIERTSFSIFSSNFLDFVGKEDKIYLSGFDTDACILASAYHGFDMGFEVRIVRDLIYSENPYFNDIGLKILERNLSSLLINSFDI